MLIGISLIIVAWTCVIPIALSVAMTVVGALMFEVCCTYFVTRFLKVAKGNE